MLYSNSQEAPAVEIFGLDNISALVWPDSVSGRFVREMFLPMLVNGISRYVRNIKGELFILKVGDELLPLTVLEREYANAPIASPYAMYTSFTLHELKTIQNRLLRGILLSSAGALIYAIQPLFKACRFNRVVLVNGFPFSTALYPRLSAAEIAATVSALTVKFAVHAIAFRTVDLLNGGELMQHLRSAGGRLIYHRPAYHLPCNAPNYKNAPALRRDLALLKKTPYQIMRGPDLTAADVSRMSELYDALFIAKYGPFNPQYTPEFFQLAAQAQSMEILALKKDGRIDGFIGLYNNGQTVADPFLGHDQDLPKSLGIYRMLAAQPFLKAKAMAAPVNYSAGVGLFKRRRGCKLTIEYLAVFVDHLPGVRRLPWRVLELCNCIAILIMRKIEF